MTTHRDLLDLEIGTPPPSTIDIDSLISRQRRRVRLRQVGFAGVAVAIVLAVGAAFLFLPRGVRMEWDTAVPSEPPSRSAEATRLTAALQQLVSQAIPGATLAKAPPPISNAQPGDPLVFVDRGSHFEAAAVVTDAAGTGTIRVNVGKEDTQFRSERACMSDPAPLDVKYQCEVIPVPDGAILLRSSSEIGEENFHRFYVEIIRVDGNTVSVDVSNGVIGDGPYRGQRPQPLLTMDQAIALAQEPSLATTLA
ncbi:MAG TPA: hypothetical protein VFC19_24440 [Candidatus Limnocylindrales bacterium]|nr:hypothetical protein [Candidatus Limnocylindrales bacterium]